MIVNQYIEHALQRDISGAQQPLHYPGCHLHQRLGKQRSLHRTGEGLGCIHCARSCRAHLGDRLGTLVVNPLQPIRSDFYRLAATGHLVLMSALLLDRLSHRLLRAILSDAVEESIRHVGYIGLEYLAGGFAQALADSRNIQTVGEARSHSARHRGTTRSLQLSQTFRDVSVICGCSLHHRPPPKATAFVASAVSTTSASR